MTANWPHEARSGLGSRVPAGPGARLALVALVAIGAFFLGSRTGGYSEDAELCLGDVRTAAGRQRELEAQVARQHAELLRQSSELESLEMQLEGIELQLDGVDYLSRQVRSELGLPATSGTWEGTAPDSGRGGRAESGLDLERLNLDRQRLATGLRDLSGLLEVARARAVERSGEPALAAPTGRAAPANWPARGAVTSSFGWRWFRGVLGFHTGVDVALPYGTPVAATGDGLVLGSGWQRGYGWSVFVLNSGGYNTLFGHLSEAAVRVGDRVTPGMLIGLSGSSGNSTGPHLHYEIWKDGRLLDPRPYMDGTGVQ